MISRAKSRADAWSTQARKRSSRPRKRSRAAAAWAEVSMRTRLAIPGCVPDRALNRESSSWFRTCDGVQGCERRSMWSGPRQRAHCAHVLVRCAIALYQTVPHEAQRIAFAAIRADGSVRRSSAATCSVKGRHPETLCNRIDPRHCVRHRGLQRHGNLLREQLAGDRYSFHAGSPNDRECRSCDTVPLEFVRLPGVECLGVHFRLVPAVVGGSSHGGQGCIPTFAPGQRG